MFSSALEIIPSVAHCLSRIFTNLEYDVMVSSCWFALLYSRVNRAFVAASTETDMHPLRRQSPTPCVFVRSSFLSKFSRNINVENRALSVERLVFNLDGDLLAFFYTSDNVSTLHLCKLWMRRYHWPSMAV